MAATTRWALSNDYKAPTFCCLSFLCSIHFQLTSLLPFLVSLTKLQRSETKFHGFQELGTWKYLFPEVGMPQFWLVEDQQVATFSVSFIKLRPLMVIIKMESMI